MYVDFGELESTGLLDPDAWTISAQDGDDSPVLIASFILWRWLRHDWS